MNSWSDYWRAFDALCASLADAGEDATVSELRDAQQCVNGLTDGWEDFLAEFRRVVARHSFSVEQATAIKQLEDTLESALRRRA